MGLAVDIARIDAATLKVAVSHFNWFRRTPFHPPPEFFAFPLPYHPLGFKTHVDSASSTSFPEESHTQSYLERGRQRTEPIVTSSDLSAIRIA